MNLKGIIRWVNLATAAALVMLALPILPAYAQSIVISPTSGNVGATVSLSAAAFTPGATYRIHFAYLTAFETITSGTVSGTGTIAGSFVVTAAPAATYNVRVETSTTEFSSATFTVTPKINLNTTTVQVGDSLDISGLGFRATSTITVRFDSVTKVQTDSDANGTFASGGFAIPATYSGSHSISVTDGTNTVTATVAIQPKVILSPVSGAPGSTATISGSGFGASRTVRIAYDGTSLTTTPSALASSNVGAFSATFAVPANFARTQTVTASDGAVSASATFSLLAGINLNPSTGSSGGQSVITGGAFAANRPVAFMWDNTILATSPPNVTSSGIGAFTATITVPVSTGGQHNVKASDDTNTANASFTITPKLVLTPASGSVGATVAVSGTGFGNSQQVILEMDGSQLTTVVSDVNGSFSASFVVPQTPQGQRPVGARDGVFTTGAGFTVVPSIKVIPDNGPTSTKVSVLGTGFGATRQVTIRFGDLQVATGNTNAVGSFSESFTVPQVDAADYEVNASDGTGTAVAGFNVTSSISLGTQTGDIGASVTVSGSGFSGNVTIKYDDSTVATIVAGPDGKFSVSFNVPVSDHGVHIVTASDSAKSLTSSFTVESTAPSAPSLLLPESGKGMGARPTFTWDTVVDPSGVAYDLEIAEDAAFSKTALLKQGLLTTEYTLSKEEGLKPLSDGSPYYWRVRAVDGAANEGDWSSPRTFTVSVIPVWILWTLGGIGVVVFALLFFWLGVRAGRRTAGH